MAQYIIPQNYQNMMEALNSYANKTATAIEKLYAISNACKQELGDSDIVAQKMDPKIQQIANHYSNVAAEARKISSAMGQELEEYYERIKRSMEQSDGDVD